MIVWPPLVQFEAKYTTHNTANLLSKQATSNSKLKSKNGKQSESRNTWRLLTPERDVAVEEAPLVDEAQDLCLGDHLLRPLCTRQARCRPHRQARQHSPALPQTARMSTQNKGTATQTAPSRQTPQVNPPTQFDGQRKSPINVF